MVQLAITCAGVAGLYVSKDWNLIFKRYEAMLMIPSIVVAVVIMCGIACCKTCSRKVPMNYICLLVYTLAITILVMAVAGKYNPESVLLCASMTASVTFGIVMMGCVLKGDMYWCFGCLAGPVFGSIPVALFVTFGVLNGSNSIYGSPGLMLLFGYLLCTILSIYIIYDVGIIIDKNVGLSYDDYIIAALILYSDIIYMFLWLLSLFGGGSSD